MSSQDGRRDKESLFKIIGKMMVKNIDFTLRMTGGSTIELILPSRKLKAKEFGNFMKGSHLSRMMLLEVENKLSNGLYVPFNQDNDRRKLNTIMYDPYNLNKLINQPIAAVDIVSCYWTTAYNLNIISEDLFKKGFGKDREWKEARAASIGSLNTLIKEYKNIDGNLTIVASFRRPYNIVRLDIIDTVWNIANEIALDLHDSFCMFLTDCFYVNLKDEKKVYELLEKHNYKAKSKYCFFNNIVETPRSYKVIWSDKENFNKEINFKKDNIVSWKR
jgi:hypothetical protein